MAEYSADAVQTINPGESIIFTTTDVPCVTGAIRHRDDTPQFVLSGASLPTSPCMRKQTVNYDCVFSCDMAVSAGGTAGEVMLGITISGSALPSTTMTITPTAVSAFFNVAKATTIPVWHNGCCQIVTIENLSTQPVDVRHSVIRILEPGQYR